MTALLIVLILLAVAVVLVLQRKDIPVDMGSTARDAGVRLAPDLEAVAAAAEAARKAERRRWL